MEGGDLTTESPAVNLEGSEADDWLVQTRSSDQRPATWLPIEDRVKDSDASEERIGARNERSMALPMRQG